MTRLLRLLCPRHGWLGWSYNTHRRRRFCRFCGHQQRYVEGSEVASRVLAGQDAVPVIESEWEDV